MESISTMTSSNSSDGELHELCPDISGSEPRDRNCSIRSSAEPGEDADLEFQNIHKWFNSLHDPSTEDHVRYQQAKLLDKQRKARVASEKSSGQTPWEPLETRTDEQLIDILNNAHPVAPEANETNEPQPESTSLVDEDMSNLPPRAKGERKANIPTKEASRLREFGMEIILSKRKKQDQSTKKKRNKSSNKALFTDAELDELFVGNYIQDAQASASMAALPNSNLRDKRKVVAEWIASAPLDEKAAARSDAERIIEASNKYKGKAKYTECGWKVKGLKTLLKPYQLEAGGWMIDREQSTSKPRGGLLCHQMGLGKTLTALLTVNERQALDPKAPTLVVVPRHLVDHWITQLREHCWNFKAIAYCSGYRVATPNLTQHLKDQDIVITAYEEVRSSYPSVDLPEEVKTSDEIEKWWQTNVNDKRGPFHEIYWHRIILDEGHLIRNRESKTSIAVRALAGKHKWVVTGTPLHNRVNDLFPYLAFIDVHGASTFDEFTHNFCLGETGERRLKTMVRLVTHRRTHHSRLFSAPLLKLPNITERHIMVDLCPAERFLNQQLQDYFIDKINNATGHFRQTHGILTLVLRCRMFTSHLLTAQQSIQGVLNDQTMNHLITMVNEQGEKDGPSVDIIKYLHCMREKTPVFPAAPTSSTESETQRPRPPEDKGLLERFQFYLTILHEQESWVERVQRYSCGSCGCAPLKSFVTSCLHRYCEECFEVLPGEDGNTDNAERICKLCELKIQSAISYVDVIDSNTSSSDGHIVPPSSKKRKTDDTEQSRPRSANAKRKRHQRKRNFRSLSGWLTAQNSFQQPTGVWETIEQEPDVDSEYEPHAEPTVDLIDQIGSDMPGAKLDAVRDVVRKWIAEDQTVKIVLFVEFMDSIRVLEDMCRKSKWKCVVMHGKVPPKTRSSRINAFRGNEENRIMITSMKVGGIGIDLSMANKCVIYDLGWNAAVEQQAFCRLHRLGQTREVEYVKLMAKDTIDEWIFELQNRKTKEINKYISNENFMNRNTIRELLAMFGNVTDVQDGGFLVTTNKT